MGEMQAEYQKYNHATPSGNYHVTRGRAHYRSSQDVLQLMIIGDRCYAAKRKAASLWVENRRTERDMYTLELGSILFGSFIVRQRKWRNRVGHSPASSEPV